MAHMGGYEDIVGVPFEKWWRVRSRGDTETGDASAKVPNLPRTLHDEVLIWGSPKIRVTL